jgi:argininosuccinate synthase
MKERIVLAYSGSVASSAAVAWLLERHGADVVALTADVGQTADLEEVRSRALACGAVRAHVIDARERFARDYVVPALRHDGAASSMAGLADPLIARTLADVAAIEHADAVAHAAADDRFERHLAATAPSLRVLPVADEWAAAGVHVIDYARARHLPGHVDRRDRHLLIRPSVAAVRAPADDARLDIAFHDGVPASLNGVPMMLDELIESLSLIAGQYGVGAEEQPHAPAAVVLRAAYAAAEQANEGVRVTLKRGHFTVEKGMRAPAAVLGQ